MNKEPNFITYGKPYSPDGYNTNSGNTNNNAGFTSAGCNTDPNAGCSGCSNSDCGFSTGSQTYSGSDSAGFGNSGPGGFDNGFNAGGPSGFDSGTGGFDGGPSAPQPKAKKKKKKTGPQFITKKCFIIAMICCMVATSGITLLGVNLMSKTSGNTISATNYTLSKSTGSEKSIEEIVAANQDAVVEIRTESVAQDALIQNYITEGAGSGVIIDTDGYILTCNHVSEGASNITVTLKNGKNYKASVVGTDPQTDVAVIKIKGSGFSAAKYGNVKDLSVGDLAVAIGNPLGELGGTASTGIISSLSRELDIDGKTMTLLQTDASINPGNSGGGLFDGHGNLIGIVVAKSSGSDVEGLGFAIPINKAAEIAKDLIENGKVTDRAMLGIKILNATDAEAARQYNLDAFGIYVAELSSPESRESGLQPGDRIISIDGSKISRLADISKVLDKHKPGDSVKIEVVRDDEKQTFDITLSEAQ